MITASSPREELLAEIENLRVRLEDMDETLRAAGSGEGGAFVTSGTDGEQVFTPKGAEQPYRVLVETMNEGAATLTDDGIILFCNNRLAAMLQVPAERLIGSRLDSYVSPADRPLFTAKLEKCAGECAIDEITMVTGADNSVPVLISCCAYDLCGNRGISLLVTDLTQQKRNQEITASESLAHSIIEQAGEAIVVCDEVGNIIRASRSAHRLCGVNPLLKPFNEMFRLRIRDTECLLSVLTPLHGGCFESVEVEFNRSDDQIFHLLLNAAPLRSVQNQIIGCVVTLTDFTERKQAEEDLQKAHDELEQRVAERTEELALSIELLEEQIEERERVEKTLLEESIGRLRAVETLREKEQMLIQQSRQAAMGEMIGNIAHQWRQPLNTLGLTIQRQLLYYDLGEFTRELLVKDVNSSMELIQHMSKTIDDFRGYFRPDKEKAEFNVRGAIVSTLSLLEGSLQNPRISVEVVTNDNPAIYGFQNEFAQVLLNILINARDVLIERKIAAPRMTITIGIEDDRAVVTVADNAGGVPGEIIGKIFDPYFTTKGPQHGTGVGLFMSKTIIEKNMGGSLTVRNTADGAEFRIEVCNEIRI